MPELRVEVTLPRLAETCLGENDRRLAPYDPHLVRPRLVPRLVRLGLRTMPRDRAERAAA